MIQRVQSIYLCIAAILAGCAAFSVSLWTTVADSTVYAQDLIHHPSVLLKTIFFAFLISAGLSLVAIFLFKKRQLQFVLGHVNLLVNLYLLGVLIYVSQTLPGEAAVSEKGIGLFFPIVVVLLLVIANKAIKKDEELVKSVDRLR